MQVTVNWKGKVQFAAENTRGHTYVMDGPEDHGGENLGPRPMEMILMGLGGCSQFDVITILQKSRQKVQDCAIEISAERADEIPAVFTKIHMNVIVKGESLKEAHVKRAVELSIDKYCSVVKMLRQGGVEITHSYSIEQVDP